MKNIMEKIKEIKKMPNGKAIFFFGFYLIFFIFVFLLINFGSNNKVTFKDYEDYKGNDFDYSYFLQKNYGFTYKIFLDGVEYQYFGKQNRDNSLFQFKENNYYCFGDDYYIYNNGSLVTADNPYVIDSLLVDSDTIGGLVALASLDSKTEYESGKKTYTYLISTNTINQEFYGINSDFFEEPNRIVINTNVDNIIDEITLYFDSFCTLNGICQNSLKIELYYDKFGEIEEINNPMN